MAISEIRESLAHGILEITIDRPERKNALTLAMYDALGAALRGASTSADVRVVVLRGAGGAFTSGNDLQDFLQHPPTGDDSPVFRFLSLLHGFDKPLVAAVEGHAVGIGTTLLLHCDLVYAAENARFQLPFVNLGLVPEAASSLVLPRMLGRVRAAELLFFGDPFDAATACGLGIVNAVFPQASLHDEVARRARTLAEKPPGALCWTKRLLAGSFGDDIAARMKAEGAVFVERLASAEVAEAISAFFEKRKPDFAKLR